MEGKAQGSRAHVPHHSGERSAKVCARMGTFTLSNPCPSCVPPPETGITPFYNKDTEAGRTEAVAKQDP